MLKNKIVPLILTCERDLTITAQFVSSFQTVQTGLAAPICAIDLTANSELSQPYLDLIATLKPRSIHYHPREADMSDYDSVLEAVHWALQRALAETEPDDLILFLEDDIIFSRYFLKKLQTYQLKPDCGLVTFYMPWFGYARESVPAKNFYGTQCVLLPHRSLIELVDNHDYMKARYQPGYDKRWGYFLEERGYKIYNVGYSYIQHLGRQSHLQPGLGSHQSVCYVDNIWLDFPRIAAGRIKYRFLKKLGYYK